MSNDAVIAQLLALSRLRVNTETGEVFAPRSNTPDKPLGALTRKGYLRTCINFEGRQFYFMLHRVVWIAAHGIPPAGMEVNHRNGRKDDNRLANFELTTGAENLRHAKDSNLLRPVRGDRHYAARLTAAQVQQIRERATEDSSALAAEFGVSRGHIRRIVTGKRWRDEMPERVS